MGDLPGSVLFACTLNAVRSPMAEALLKQLHGKHVFVDSVGVRPEQVDPFAVETMAELGLDISKHRAKSFDQLADSSFDLIITLSPEAHHRALEMTRIMACDVEYWPTFDPDIVEAARDVKLAFYRQIRDHLKKRIQARFPALVSPGG